MTANTEYDFSEYSDSQMLTLIALANMMQKRFAEFEKAAKRVQEDRLEEGARENAYLGGVRIADVSRSMAGEGRWIVTDPVLYGRWLDEHDMGGLTESRPMPVGDAMEPGFLNALVNRLTDGEVPDGVDWRNARPATINVKLSPEGEDMLFRNRSLNGMMKRLLEGGKEPSGPGMERSEEAVPETRPEPEGPESDDVFSGMGL